MENNMDIIIDPYFLRLLAIIDSLNIWDYCTIINYGEIIDDGYYIEFNGSNGRVAIEMYKNVVKLTTTNVKILSKEFVDPEEIAGYVAPIIEKLTLEIGYQR